MENIMTNWYSGASVPRLIGTRGTGPPLNPHQVLVVNHMKRHHRLLVVHGTGSGKTLTSVHVANDYLNGNQKRIVIFVTPAAVQEQFKKVAALLLAGRPGVYFTSYDGLTRFLGRLFTNRHATMKSVIKNALIVADEAHYITEKTEKARVFYDIFKSADKVLLMTGTPVQNGDLKDLKPYAKILNPAITVPDVLPAYDFEKFFKCKISVYEVPSTHKKFPKMLPKERISKVLTKNQSNTIVKQRSGQYNWTTVMSRITSNATNNFSNSLRRSGWAFNRKIYANLIFKNINTEPKFQEFLKIYTQRPYKTIVYFQQYVSLDRFRVFLTKHGIPFQEISGRPNKTNKSNINSKTGKMVYLLTKAAKEGLDFKGVRTVIFMDYPWTPSNYNQIVGRARRFESHMHLPNSERNVKVYELVYDYRNPKTLNVRSLNILNTKRTKIASIMAKLKSVSIERRRCTTVSPMRARTPSPPNKFQPRPNRRIVRNALGTYVAVSPGGTLYYTSNLNKPITTALIAPRTTNNSLEGFASLRKRKRGSVRYP